jgi:SAM-dependent methyltransferase
MEPNNSESQSRVKGQEMVSAESACRGRDAIDAWLRFYEDPKNMPGFLSPSGRLSQYNEFFFHRIVKELAPRLRPGNPVRLWSAGSGIDYVSLKLKAIYGDSIEITIFDVSEDCISANRRAFAENDLQADFVVGDLFKASYFGEFDMVFNTGLLEHFQRKEQEVLLRILSDSLRPGGEYLTYVPYAGGRLYIHCMERMRANGVWKFGPETPIATFGDLQSGDLILVEEFPLDALQQLGLLRPAYPLLGLVILPATSILMRFPGVFERLFMRLFGGYGLYARFEKPLVVSHGTNSA